MHTYTYYVQLFIKYEKYESYRSRYDLIRRGNVVGIEFRDSHLVGKWSQTSTGRRLFRPIFHFLKRRLVGFCLPVSKWTVVGKRIQLSATRVGAATSSVQLTLDRRRDAWMLCTRKPTAPRRHLQIHLTRSMTLLPLSKIYLPTIYLRASSYKPFSKDSSKIPSDNIQIF